MNHKILLIIDNKEALDKNENSEVPPINVEVEVGKYVLVEFSGKGQRGSLRRLHCGNFKGATVYDTIFTEGM